MRITPEILERNSRMLALHDFSKEDMASVLNTRVAMVGAGGLGSPALRLLTAIGFGKIRVIDRDIVELSNIQRQTIYNHQDIGKPKAVVAVENLSVQNPDVEFEPICATVTEDNVIELLKGVDIIVDGLDSFKAIHAINYASLSLGIPYVFAGAVEYYANLSTFIPRETGCLYCLMGDAKDNPDNTCAQIGVSPSLLSIASAIEVREAVLLAIGRSPNLKNRLMSVDISAFSFDTFEISRIDDCPVCSGDVVASRADNTSPSIVTLCSGSVSIAPQTRRDLKFSEIIKRLDSKYEVLSEKGFLVIQAPDNVRITIMSGGNAVVREVKNEESAKRLYDEIVGE